MSRVGRHTCFFMLASFVWACSPNTDGNGPDGPDMGSESCIELGYGDQDSDGIPDSDEGDDSVDTDSDGKPDYRDTDSDDDGRHDMVESGRLECDAPAIDSDGDGTPDYRDTDSDDNGLDDYLESNEDMDGDGEQNWRDLDDDGDMISDAIELGDDPLVPTDTNGDGVPDFHSDDADGDGIWDIFEGDTDLDEDGKGCWQDEDCDGDGYLDEEEAGSAPGERPVDTDGDGAMDFRDPDSDGDNLDDIDERAANTLRTEKDSDDDGFTDYQEVQAGSNPLDGYDYPRPDPCSPDDCELTEYCGELGNGDGLDNDCNGEVDEICPCTAGETRTCFPGPPSKRGLGACADGIESCNEFGEWGACVGSVAPTEEICDGTDNDCDGEFDEELEDCHSPLRCPSTTEAPPLSTFELRGQDIYDGAYESWTWEVFCPPTIDESVGGCPDPEEPDARTTSVYFVASGSYTIRATIAIDGQIYTCQFAVNVQGDGLRVELLWDTQGAGNGDTDIDLHLHRPETTTNWFSDDDCYYPNCTASDFRYGGVDWGFEPTADVTACNEAPHSEGATWDELGYCNNPRLDVDVIRCDPSVTTPTSGSYCAPENINVDNPELGQTFRILVNFFSGSAHTVPTINIYCGGGLRATLGGRDEVGEPKVLLTDAGGSSGENWIVADVRFTVDECDAIDCVVTPILDENNDEWLQMGTDFGPPWTEEE